ncbi:MAG: ATP-binding cassette domain-containing protein [Deltaproteobacteria bacterium]|nr:ATP-binding cassette domain-containing protein [Deltaproteobacteria bacterium]
MDKVEPIIKVENLVAGYGETVILENISFNVHPGEIFVILGGSGCGKSTLLKHLIGLISPFSGVITVDGDQLTEDDEGTFMRILRKIGVLYQSSALLGSMTIGENIALPIGEYSGLAPEPAERIIRMKLRLVGLDGYENYLPSEISGGMKKRAGIARAMALNPRILFFDEPSAGLDPVTSADIDELILNLNKMLKTTMVVVTHELSSIFNIAHRIIMLDRETKGIIAEGDPRDLRDNSTDPYVREFFNPGRGNAGKDKKI